MARIFLSVSGGVSENSRLNSGMLVADTTEIKEIIQIRDLTIAELRSRGLEVLAVPDDFTQAQTIDWIDTRARLGDVALQIQASSASGASGGGGAGVFYIAANNQRQADAQMLMMCLLRRFPQLHSRGAVPDTAAGLGRLMFCRWVSIPSLSIELSCFANPEDKILLSTRRGDIALGIADGLASWIRPQVEPSTHPPINFYPITINLNGGTYAEDGILINGNACIPIDLVDRLGIDLSAIAGVRRLAYKNIVYVKAIELRDFEISVSWDRPNRAVVLQSNVRFPGQIHRIMGSGSTTEVQLMMFLRSNNQKALTAFPDLAKLYREEAAVEGVNYDIAFCQMCLETNFLQFLGEIRSTQNNFGGLGGVSPKADTASFASARIGVRAHVQHLKAYASTEPLVQELVDPRFRFVTRSIAPDIAQLSGRWAPDLQYGARIIALVRRLYEIAGLL